SWLRAGLNPCNTLPGQSLIRSFLQVFNATRRSLGMLRLRYPVAGSNIMQQEITKGVDDFVAECLRHSAQVAPRLGIGVVRLDRRPRWGRGMVGVVTNGTAERFVIPEE